MAEVVSAKAEMDGRKVALGAPLTNPVALLQAELEKLGPSNRPGNVRILSGGSGGKFIKP